MCFFQVSVKTTLSGIKKCPVDDIFATSLWDLVSSVNRVRTSCISAYLFEDTNVKIHF